MSLKNNSIDIGDIDDLKNILLIMHLLASLNINSAKDANVYVEEIIEYQFCDNCNNDVDYCECYKDRHYEREYEPEDEMMIQEKTDVVD